MVIKSIVHKLLTRYRFSQLIRKNDCKIGSHVLVGNKVVIGKRCKIGRNTTLRNIVIGDDSVVEAFVRCVGSEKGTITIGQNSYIGTSNFLDNSTDISIGCFVQIAGPSTALWTHSGALMCLNRIPIAHTKDKYRPIGAIVIEDCVYVGGNCTIYPGVRIGHHSIIAPNSAVTKDVPPYTMVGGVPAKIIKSTHSMIDNLHSERE